MSYVMPAFDSMDIYEKSLPLDIPVPYDSMEYIPDGLLIQSEFY